MSVDNQELEGQEVEVTAKNMGWTPKEEFKGNPDHWVDAEEYVERGMKLMPILRENNKRLQKELLTRDQKIDTLARKLDGATAALEKLEHHYTEANKRSVENAKLQLREELKQAREEDDVDKEQSILGKLDDIRDDERDAAKKEADKKTTPPPKQEDSALSPEFVEWKSENPWFGEDKKKTKAIVRIAEDLRDEGNTTEGRAFMEECVRVYEEQEPQPRNTPNKVEGDPPRRPNSSSSSKGFSSLPKEAKEACWADIEDLVGPDKRYKDQKSWENAYAKLYYGE
jgi:hypothetical protein